MTGPTIYLVAISCPKTKKFIAARLVSSTNPTVPLQDGAVWTELVRAEPDPNKPEGNVDGIDILKGLADLYITMYANREWTIKQEHRKKIADGIKEFRSEAVEIAKEVHENMNTVIFGYLLFTGIINPQNKTLDTLARALDDYSNIKIIFSERT